MITSKTIRTITDMRKNASELLRFVADSKQPVGILKNNKLAAYLVDPNILEGLEALVEDYLDLKMVTERLRDNKLASLEAFWKKKKLPR